MLPSTTSTAPARPRKRRVVLVLPGDLLRRVLRPRGEQQRAHPDEQRPLGHPRGTVGRPHGGEGGEGQYQRGTGRRQRGDRDPVEGERRPHSSPRTTPRTSAVIAGGGSARAVTGRSRRARGGRRSSAPARSLRRSPELLGRGGTRDHRADRRLAGEPGDRQLEQRDPALTGERRLSRTSKRA